MLKQKSGNFPVPVNNHTNSNRENQLMVHRALGRHRKRIFPPLPDLARYRLVQGHLRKELEMGFAFRLKQLSLEQETALHQIREQCNQALVTGKTHLRKERMAFFADSYHEVVEQFNDLADRFLTDLDRRLQRLEKYRSQAIREREEARLESSVDNFLATLDQLVDEYRSIISEHIDHEQVD